MLSPVQQLSCPRGHRIEAFPDAWGIDPDGYLHVDLWSCYVCDQAFGIRAGSLRLIAKPDVTLHRRAPRVTTDSTVRVTARG
jgi:hypothetical protein